MFPFLVVHPEVLMLVTVTPNSGFKILTSDRIKELVSKYRSFQMIPHDLSYASVTVYSISVHHL